MFDKKPAVYVGKKSKNSALSRWYRLIDKNLPTDTNSITVDGSRGLLYFAGKKTKKSSKNTDATSNIQKRSTSPPKTTGFISVSSLTSISEITNIWNSNDDDENNACTPTIMTLSAESGDLYFACRRDRNELRGDLIIQIENDSRKPKNLVNLAGRVVGLSVVADRLYWSDADKYEIRSVEISKKVEYDEENEGRFETSLDRITVSGMTMIDKNLKKPTNNPCAKNNGNCEGICLLGNNAYKRD